MLVQADGLDSGLSWGFGKLPSNFGSAKGFIRGLCNSSSLSVPLLYKTHNLTCSPAVSLEHKHLGMDYSFLGLTHTVPLRE